MYYKYHQLLNYNILIDYHRYVTPLPRRGAGGEGSIGKGKFRKVLLALSVLLLFTNNLTAQTTINTESFFSLSTGATAPQASTTTAVKMPWFESYDFRTETRDFDLDRQEYTFRLSPSTRGKVRAQESLYRHLESAPDFKAQDDQCRALADRYSDWLKLYFLDREAQLLARLERVRTDQSTVLNRLAGTLDFDWSELINIREEQTDLNIERLTLQAQTDYYTKSYGLERVALDFSDLLPPAQMQERIGGATLATIDPELMYEIETINRELDLERAEQKQYFDFAQVKYQGPHNDPARERLSVGIAFRLPTSGDQVLKLRELELEAEALRAEQAREAAGKTTDLEARRQLLLGHFNRYATLTDLYLREKQEFEDLSRKLSGREGINPLPLLKIKARALRNELKLLRLEEELYDGYLDLMERNGEVCAGLRGEVLR